MIYAQSNNGEGYAVVRAFTEFEARDIARVYLSGKDITRLTVNEIERYVKENKSDMSDFQSHVDKLSSHKKFVLLYWDKF